MHPHSISVIIPVYNGDRYLAAAIDSVLAQTYPVQEIIVVDDGSTDQSATIARQYSAVTLIPQSHLGLSATRNRGVQAATGKFVAFLDADDLWLPDKLNQQMQVFTNNPDASIVFTHIQPFFSPDLDAALKATLYCPSQPIPGTLATTMLTRRTVLEQVGKFDPQLMVGETIDWVTRAQDAGMVVLTLPAVLAQRRIHANNMGVRSRHAQQDYVHLVKAALDRRRKMAQIPGVAD